MFNIFNKKPAKTNSQTKKLVIGINGMHCVSCSMNIDGELEELKGVSSSTTNYAQSKCTIEFDPKVINESVIFKTIEKLGYSVADTRSN
jgi:Cu+-exporting ATPase